MGIRQPLMAWREDMTTTVTVQAHCDPETTQVRVTVFDNQGLEHLTILEDQESCESYVYDDRELVVREIPKPKEEDQ